MPKQEFEFLDIEEQTELIFAGQFIKSIGLENRTVSLYLVENEYYVEVYSEENSKQIDFIIIASDERLPLYVEIDTLMN